LLANLKIFLAN